MKPKHVFALLFLLMALSSAFAMAQQHDPITRPGPIIPDIWSGDLDHELVAVEGFVEFWEEIPNTTVIKYHLRDKWANTISVLSPNERPVVKTVLYRVIGTVNIIGDTPERFIDERSRVAIEGTASKHDEKELAKKSHATTESAEPKQEEKETARKSRETPETTPAKQDEKQLAINAINNATPVVEAKSGQWWTDNKAAETSLRSANFNFAAGSFEKTVADANQAVVLSANPPFSTIFYLIIVAVVVLVLLAIVLLVAATRGSGSGRSGHSFEPWKSREPGLPKPVEKIKGDAISMDMPPSGTLKILPGRLEIIGGDSKVSEIRLYRTSENPDLEYTFGRMAGSPYRHIQLDHPTISHEQAKLLYSNGVYTLINRADPVKSNSTMINDVEMAMNQVCALKDNDKIGMGAVIMRYHANGK